MEENQDYLQCTYENHNHYKIDILCLNKLCKNKGKACDKCVEEKHLDHQDDCLSFNQTIFNIECQLSIFRRFTQMILTQYPFFELKKISALQTEMKRGIKILQDQNRFSEIHKAIDIALRCYNQLIHEEIKHFIYELEHLKIIDSETKIKVFQIMEKCDDQVKIEFLTQDFLSKGDNLRKYKNKDLAVEYYNKALDLTEGEEEKYQIQLKIYDLLLETQFFEKATETLTQINKTSTPSAVQYLVRSYLIRALKIWIKRPEFQIAGDIFRRALKYTDNEILLNAMLLWILRNYDEAFSKAREVQRSDPAFSFAVEIQSIFLHNQVLSLLRMSQLDRALDLINKEIILKPQNPVFHYWRNLILIISNKNNDTIFEKEFPQYQNILHLMKSMTLARIGNLDEALMKFSFVYLWLNVCINQAFCQNIKQFLIHMQVENPLINFKDYNGPQKIIRLEHWAYLYDKGEFQKALNTLIILECYEKNLYQIFTLKAVIFALAI